jgi:hypothetical protein
MYQTALQNALNPSDLEPYAEICVAVRSVEHIHPAYIPRRLPRR